MRWATIVLIFFGIGGLLLVLGSIWSTELPVSIKLLITGIVFLVVAPFVLLWRLFSDIDRVI